MIAHGDRAADRNDNDIYGFMGGGLLGSPLTVGMAQDGWYAGNRQVDAITNIDSFDGTMRTTPTLTVSYNPTNWFTNRLNVGADLSRTESRQYFPLNQDGWYATALNVGQMTQYRQNRDQYTLDYLGNVSTAINPQITGDFSFGAQYIATRSDLTWSQGRGFTTNAANAVTLGAERTGGQSFSENRQAGVFGQAQFGYLDRVFVQVAGRVDQASAFGADAPPFFSPKVGVSWVISEEPFFQPALGALPSLRLRGAWGTTGRSPTRGAFATYAGSPFAVDLQGNVGAGVIPQDPGNPNLRAERGTELELGFDAGILGERVGLEVTYFNKTSRDIILARPLAPSAGFTQNPLVNIGEMVNRGLEVAANASIISTPNFGWEARLGFNTLHNEITDLGDVEPFGTMNRREEGYQAGAFFGRPILEVVTGPNAAERCGAGRTECALVRDSLEFQGNFLPSFEGTFSNTFTVMRNLRVTGQVDWKSDFYTYNNSAQFRERQMGTGERWVRRNELLTDEERIRRFGPFINSETGAAISTGNVWEEYVEAADFVRLRELALTYTLPDNFARMLRTTSASVTLAGRNLALWTDYSGTDPELDSSADLEFSRSDFLTVPQPRRWVARVNLQF
jgi:TonB-dependent starch-binding outer membrane protein SusC